MRVEYETITTKISRAIDKAAEMDKRIHQIHLTPEEWAEFTELIRHIRSYLWEHGKSPERVVFLGVECVLEED